MTRYYVNRDAQTDGGLRSKETGTAVFTPVKSKYLILLGIAILTFILWFADGYLQWVNSDTAAEAFGTSQFISFPQGLFSKQHLFHSRITGTILSYIPFHTIGYLYRELTGDPVNALFVSQGFMTGAVFTLFVLISAAYTSSPAPVLSSRYLFSAGFVLLLTLTRPILPLNSAIDLTFRFGHQAVMTNYVGTMVLALFALFPYWRYLFTGDWDWYDDPKRRTMFYVFLFAAVFSSTATMVWLGTFALVASLAIIFYSRREILKDPRIHPLILIMVLCATGVAAESISRRGTTAFAGTSLFEYTKVYISFLSSSRIAWFGGAACLLFLVIIWWEHKNKKTSPQMVTLARLFPWLLAGNLMFVFIIGMPQVPFRFSGYNLGPDTAFPATWSMSMWFLAVMVCFWSENRLTWLAPVLIYIFATNSMHYFNFYGYAARENQKAILSTIHRANDTLPMGVTLLVPVEDMAFSAEELKTYTIPMLSNFGLISPGREVSVVSREVFEYWAGDLKMAAHSEK